MACVGFVNTGHLFKVHVQTLFAPQLSQVQNHLHSLFHCIQ